MKQDPTLLAERADGCDRVEYADFVIGMHDRDHQGLIGDHFRDPIYVETAVRIDTEIGHIESTRLENFAWIEDSSMFCYDRDDVFLPVRGRLGNSLKCEVV